MDQETFARFVKSDMRENVFKQALSEDELEAAAGGNLSCGALLQFGLCGLNGSEEDRYCTRSSFRKIYEGGFPNCIATVEEGSWCSTNDACFFDAIRYEGMVECTKAWK